MSRVAKKISKDPEVRSLCGPTISVQILSSFTADYLIDHLILMFARRGFNASIRAIEYGKIATAILTLVMSFIQTLQIFFSYFQHIET